MKQFKPKKKQMFIWCSVLTNQNISVELQRCLEQLEKISDMIIFGDSQTNGLAQFQSIGFLSKTFLTLSSFIWKILLMRTSLFVKEGTVKKLLHKLVKRCFRFFSSSSLKPEFLMIFKFMRIKRNLELKKKQSIKNGMLKKNKQIKFLLKVLNKIKLSMLQELNSIKSAKSFRIDLIFRQNKTILSLLKILTTL